MTTYQNTVTNNYQRYFYFSLLAKITFLVFVFFTIFATALPFRPKAEVVDDIATANIVNQIVYSFLFVMSIISILPRRKEFIQILIQEKFLLLFIIWCTISTFWSDYTFTSFKRLFQIYCVITVTIAFLLHFNSEKAILDNIKYILYPYLILSIISVVAIPGALDPNFRTWRALTTHKNVLGQIGVISTIFCYLFYQQAQTLISKIIAIFMMFIGILLTIGSFSSTSILILLIIIALSFILVLYDLVWVK